MIDLGVHHLGHDPVHSLLQHSRPARGACSEPLEKGLCHPGHVRYPLLQHLLQHKLSDVVSQLVLVQMGAPSVVRKMI